MAYVQLGMNGDEETKGHEVGVGVGVGGCCVINKKKTLISHQQIVRHTCFRLV